MGLDVGVVNITYLDRPQQPVYDFLWAVAQGRFDEDWGGSWSGNSLVEFEKENFLEQAADWAAEQRLGLLQEAILRNWMDQLP